MCGTEYSASGDIVPETDSDAGRRAFIKFAGLGAAAAMLMGCSHAPAAHTDKSKALLLTCMDYRLTDDVVHYMDSRGMTDRYDHVILAGASLGAITDEYSEWGKTFLDHLQIAIELHHITKVMIIDHRDCGAYKTFLGEDFFKYPARETQIHTEKLRMLAKIVRTQHPELEIETLLMNLDGTVETISS